jgi:glycosyltransferase involved in cell wall biosynthesis
MANRKQMDKTMLPDFLVFSIFHFPLSISMAVLSVIIPTHKRPAILRRCLDALERQTVRDQMEIIVVSDGHDEETATMFDDGKTEIRPSSTLGVTPERCPHVRFFEIPKSQQGVARNRGVKEARGDIVLFLNDDMLAAPDCCERHLQSFSTHDSLPTTHSVLGFTSWDPSVGITPVMRWLDKTGWQFGFNRLAPYAHAAISADIQHRFTYATNMSLPREVALKIPFPEDVSGYGWEDIAWGKKLADAGIQLFYEPDTRALHHHHITLEDSLKRMEQIGRSAAAMAKKDPSFDGLPRGWKLLAYRALSLLPTMRGRHARAFFDGMQSLAKPKTLVRMASLVL